MSTVTARYPVATSGGELARRTAGGVLVGVLAALVVSGMATSLGLDLGVTGAQSPFGAIPIVTSTVVAGVGAAVAYAAIVRFTDRPVRNFSALSAAVFVVMLVPVFVIAPSLGLTTVGQGALVVMHVAVAAPLVAFVSGAVRL
ncbi:DUF6069 family protein [Haloarcula onubensis]|uniref:DUF6069 family protein n=1 Tax=Haloarcula onubensis TaxID=2950539 RepID=A0ABU2FTW2_9EURY|nr:DUF6069 family protein [Halomicroarcula sp. S3CR25-11]MDS0284190.1 DUF6069 family protein [Halomicroarcula sp. S3CR25-11]